MGANSSIFDTFAKLHNISILSSYSKSTMKITLWKKFMSLWPFWNFRYFWNFSNFWDSKWQFWLNGHKYCHFFVIYDEYDVLYILVEFESDRMSPRRNLRWKLTYKKISCLFDHFEIFVTQPVSGPADSWESSDHNSLNKFFRLWKIVLTVLIYGD